MGSAKDIVVSGIGSVGNGLVSAKNTASAFGSKSIETIGGYAHAALTGSRDCGKAVFEAVTNNPKTSGAVVAGVAGVALAVYYRKALAKKIGQAYAGTKNLLATNAYIGALAAGGTLLAGKALLQSDFLARNSATASAYFNKV